MKPELCHPVTARRNLRAPLASLLLALVALPFTPRPALAEPLELALSVEPAFGTRSRSFFNVLAGGRLDYRFSPSWSLAPYVGYANLKGPGGERVNNVLTYVLGLHRVSLSETVSLPLGLGAGYLPSNGPYGRMQAGVLADVGGDANLALDLVPAFWSVDDRTEFSLGVQLGVSLPL